MGVLDAVHHDRSENAQSFDTVLPAMSMDDAGRLASSGNSDYIFRKHWEVALQPGSGGVLEIRLNDELIFSRKESSRFPEAKEIKQLIRDRIDPDRDLGHSDRSQEEI